MSDSESSWLIIGVILGLIVLVILVLLFQALGTTEISGSAQKMCKLSNYMKWSVHEKTVVTPVDVSRMCKTQTVEVKPDDWSECNSLFEQEFYKGEKKDALKACTMQQIAEYLLSCWDMNGNGEWKTGNWVCYNINIALPEDEEATLGGASELKAEIEESVRQKLECGVDVTNPELAYTKNCEELVAKVKELVYLNMLNQNILDYYIDRMRYGFGDFSGLDTCNKESGVPFSLANLTFDCSRVNIEVSSDTIATARPGCGLSLARSTVSELCIKTSDARKDIEGNTSRIGFLINDSISNSDEVNKVVYQCTGDELKVYECMDYGNEYECSDDENILTIEKNNPEENCEFKHLLLGDLVLERMSLISADTPDLIAISESDFKTFLSRNYILG